MLIVWVFYLNQNHTTMKKLFVLLLCLAGMGMQAQESINFRGTIANDTIGNLVISGYHDAYKLTVSIDRAGNFSASPVERPDIYVLEYGRVKRYVYLSEKTNLTVTADARKFYNTLSFKGEGSAENRLLSSIVTDGNYACASLIPGAFADREQRKAEALMAEWEKKIKTGFSADVQALLRIVQAEQVAKLNERIAILEGIRSLKNKPAPPFTLKDVNGKTVNLSDFKGKYVVLDVWATWCTPCREEMPGLMEIEEKLRDKNIAFIGISIDKPAQEEKWKKFVADKALGGTQLITEGGWDCRFMKDYAVQGVPTYIIISPDGNIIEPNAEWPRHGLERQLKKLLRD